MASLKNIFNPRTHKGGDFFLAIKKLLSFSPKDITLYEEAFTHRSTNTTSIDGHAQNYERMEFLGDAMLSSIIAAHLFNEVPGGDEGYLTKMRSKVVSREHLNELGRDLELIKHVKTTVPIGQFGGNIHGNVFISI